MKLFWIGPYRPIPGGSGADLRSFYLMRELARRGVTMEGWFLGSHGTACEAFLQDSTVTPVSTLKGWLRAARRRPGGVPFSYGRYHHPPLVEGIPDDRPLYVDHLHMSVNRPPGRDAPVWLDEHNLEHRLWEEYARTANPWWRALLGPEVRRVREYEIEVLGAVDGAGLPWTGAAGSLPPSPREGIQPIPNGVPEDWLESGRRRLEEAVSTPGVYGFIGGYRWPPNRQGTRRFLDHVWEEHRERHPGDRLLLAGDGAPGGWSDRDGVETIGYVEESADFFERIDVLVVPLEMGAGTRLKVLEAAARGVPFLSTEKGVEGLELPGLETAGSIPGLIDPMRNSKQDPDHLDRQRISAHRAVRERYRWRTIGGRLHRALKDLS